MWNKHAIPSETDRGVVEAKKARTRIMRNNALCRSPSFQAPPLATRGINAETAPSYLLVSSGEPHKVAPCFARRCTLAIRGFTKFVRKMAIFMKAKPVS